MFHKASPLAPLALSLALALGAGCQNVGDDDVAPEDRAMEITEGRAISIEIPSGVERDQIHAVAKHVEHQLGGDVAGASVKVKKTEAEGPATMVVELWGSNLPDAQAVSTGLKSEFGFLADAAISVEDLDAEQGPTPAAIDHEDLSDDPEQAKQEIIDQLREQGVEGEIDVVIDDGPDGRRVEVKVEDDHEDSPEQ